jgi:hypothetical protein
MDKQHEPHTGRDQMSGKDACLVWLLNYSRVYCLLGFAQVAVAAAGFSDICWAGVTCIGPPCAECIMLLPQADIQCSVMPHGSTAVVGPAAAIQPSSSLPPLTAPDTAAILYNRFTFCTAGANGTHCTVLTHPLQQPA